MDDQSAVITCPEILTRKESPTLSADQAVFTSVRSPTGEGYRIIAASAGVTPEEKAEILRRAPSHGGLSSNFSEAKGFATWQASTGRQIIICSCYAGREHTSRGGQRVYSHLLLVDPKTYRCLGEDPLALWRLLNTHINHQGPLLKPQRYFEPFSICGQDAEYDIDPAEKCNLPSGIMSEAIWSLADLLLAGESLLIIGVNDPRDILQWALLALPAKIRPQVAASCGLNYSPQRQMQVTWLPEKPANLQRLIAGQPITIINTDALSDRPIEHAPAWFELLKKFWKQKQPERIVRLTSELYRRLDIEGLDRIARFYKKIEMQLLQGATPISSGRLADIFRSWIQADTRMVDEKQSRII